MMDHPAACDGVHSMNPPRGLVGYGRGGDASVHETQAPGFNAKPMRGVPCNMVGVGPRALCVFMRVSGERTEEEGAPAMTSALQVESAARCGCSRRLGGGFGSKDSCDEYLLRPTN